MTFAEWIAALDVAAARIGYGSTPLSQQTGVECWRPRYDAGLTPTEALSADLHYA